MKWTEIVSSPPLVTGALFLAMEKVVTLAGGPATQEPITNFLQAHEPYSMFAAAFLGLAAGFVAIRR